jgi:hypothetical protein
MANSTETKTSNKTATIGGRSSKTTVDKAAAQRRGQLRLTPARLAMLEQVKVQPNAVVTAWTNVEKNTVHAPTAERLVLLGLLAITSRNGDRVANITKLGVQAVEGGLHMDAVRTNAEAELKAAKAGEAASMSADLVQTALQANTGLSADECAAALAGDAEAVEHCADAIVADDKVVDRVEDEEYETVIAVVEPLPEPENLRGKDKRINANQLMVFLSARGITPQFEVAPGAKKLIARFGVPENRVESELVANLKAAGCSVVVTAGRDDENPHMIEVANVRYNKSLVS